MKRKQDFTKEEAILALQSQPLSARLWRKLTNNPMEHAIRFPNLSLIDSESWPDYMPVKQNQEIDLNKSFDTKTVFIEQSSLHNKPDRNVEQKTLIVKAEPETEIPLTSNVQEVPKRTDEASEEKKSIRLADKSADFEKSEKESKMARPKLIRKAKKPRNTKESGTKGSSSSDSMDFYSWLDNLGMEEKKEAPKKKVTKPKVISKTEKSERQDPKIMAENSLKLGDEIVSETLARLLSRQGHKEKAIEMYEKLILKYPEKEATFAAALQKLKS